MGWVVAAAQLRGWTVELHSPGEAVCAAPGPVTSNRVGRARDSTFIVGLGGIREIKAWGAVLAPGEVHAC